MIIATAKTGSRPKLLFLVHRAPYPPDKGDRIRTFQFLRYLATRFEVHLACFADEPVAERVVEKLRSYCKRLAIVNVQGPMRWARALLSVVRGRTVTEGAFSSSEMRAVLKQWSADTSFDCALASSSSMVPYLRLPQLRGIPAIVDLIDVDSEKWFDYASSGHGPKAWLYRLEGRRLRRLEQSLVAWAKAITLVSDAEVAIFRQFSSSEVVRAVGNGVDLDYFQPQPPQAEQGCVFLGALDYWPNIEGICWFCNEVWPEVRRRHPEATISIVGRRPTAAVGRLAEIPGVHLVGQVPDVRPYLANAAVSIVPLRIARGIQNKVLESMAMGKATIVSPQALEGLRARAGTDLLSASTPADWVDAISNLLANPALRQRIGSAGRRFTLEHHRWERCLSPLDELMGLSAEPRTGPAPLLEPAPEQAVRPTEQRELQATP